MGKSTFPDGPSPRLLRSALRVRKGLSTATLIALLLMVVAAALASWATHTVVRDQERRLLKERVAEIGLVFTTSISTVTSTLNSSLGVLKATNGSPAALTKAAAADVTRANNPRSTMALVEPAGGGNYRITAAVGPLLRPGQVLTGDRARTLAQIHQAGTLVSTPVIGKDDGRSLGFAIQAAGIPGTAPGTLLYRESPLGRVAAPRQSSSPAFHELNVVLYATRTPQHAQLLVTSTGDDLPSKGSIFAEQPAGATQWLLGVQAKAPLVGAVAANIWWVVLIVGLVGAILLAAMVEFAVRRRDAALSLYVAEHRQAETLQRSLLPSLPVIPDLDLAARYQAGGVGQQVGGDWFDAFPLSSGGVGFAIGDVVGHDLEAAAAMSQVRSALRAYAYEGEEPAAVLSRLDRLISTFELTQLVTVIYGVVSPPGAEGRRTVRFANAGHLPPLLQQPGGEVEVLSDGASVVIGAPSTGERTEAQLTLTPGSTLLLFTDGLLEAPQLSLSETIPQLADLVAGHAPEAGCEALCELVLSSRTNQEQRDDIALLALGVRTTAVNAAVAPNVAHQASVEEPDSPLVRR